MIRPRIVFQCCDSWFLNFLKFHYSNISAIVSCYVPLDDTNHQHQLGVLDAIPSSTV